MGVISEEEMIQNIIDEAADDYTTLDDILSELGMSCDAATAEAEGFRARFFELLRRYGIGSENISRLCLDVSELIKRDRSDDALFIYASLLTENGLLLGDISDTEQKILLWSEQSEQTEYIIKKVKSEHELSKRFEELAATAPDMASSKTYPEEQALLFEISLEHPFLDCAGNNVYLDNLGELIRQASSKPLLASVKPYIYSAVLTRKHKLITGRRDYSPNLPSVFTPTEYKIHKDNGKNFASYKAYLELYGHLRDCYADEADIALSDYCFAHMSNLSEWFYENCEPTDDIPMTLRQTADIFGHIIDLGMEGHEAESIRSVLEIAYDNVLMDDEKWADFVSAMQSGDDITPYAERLYERAGAERFCADKAAALSYARLCLLWHMENVNRDILVNAAEYL